MFDGLKRRSARTGTLLAAATLILAGCGGGQGLVGSGSGSSGGGSGGGGNNGGAAVKPIVKSNVKVVPSDGSATVSNLSETSVTLGGTFPVLQANDVIVSAASGGFIRKVVSVAASGGQTVVQTQPGSLTDVFQQADIQLEAGLGAGDFQPAASLPAGITFNTTQSRRPQAVRVPSGRTVAGQSRATVELPVLNVNFANVALGAGTGATATVSGNLKMQPTVTVNIRVRKSKTLYFKVLYQDHPTYSFAAAVGGKVEVPRIPLGEFKRTLIRIIPGTLIPLVLTPTETAYLSGEVNFTAGKFESTYAADSPTEVGMECEGTSCKTINNNSTSASFDVTGTTGTMEGSAQIVAPGVETYVDINKAGGPFIKAEYAVNIAASTNHPECGFKVSADDVLTGAVGIKLNPQLSELLDVSDLSYAATASLPLKTIFNGYMAKDAGNGELSLINGIRINPESASLKVKGSQTLKVVGLKVRVTGVPVDIDAHCVTWTSSNPGVASITSEGVVTGQRRGTTQITAKLLDSDLSATATIVVGGYAGLYTGKSKGTFFEPGDGTFGVTGTFEVRVDANGKISGTVTDSEDNTLDVAGAVDDNGNANFATATGGSVSAKFKAKIDDKGAVSGTYTSSDSIGGRGSGTFTGSRTGD